MSPATELPATAATFPSFESFLTLGLFVGIAIFLIGVLLFISWAIGYRTRNRVKQEPYESGIYPTGEARLKAPIPYSMVAILFIIFDIEVIFVVSWAVAYDRLGWAGFAQITFFIFILFLGLIHLWKTGALEWGPNARHRKRIKGEAS